MKKTVTQLQQASQKVAIATLACGMIHDLNNILSSILGFAELATMGISSGVNVDKDLGEVIKAGLKARNLVNQILTFIRQGDVQKIPVEVTRLIKEAMKHIRALLPASIEISFQPGAFKGFILIDPVQFHRILIILCSIASHAMKEKAGFLEIRLQGLRLDKKNVMQHNDLKPSQYLQLSICDAGDGMPKDNMAPIFDLLRTSDSREGLFPGLSLVQGMIREMGGVISVCDESEKGTIFHLLFPEYEKESE